METATNINGTMQSTVQSIEAGHLNDSGMNITANKNKVYAVNGKLVNPQGNIEVVMPVLERNQELSLARTQLAKAVVAKKMIRAQAAQDEVQDIAQQEEAEANKEEKMRMEEAEKQQQQQVQQRDNEHQGSYTLTTQTKKGMSSALKYSLIGGGVVTASVAVPASVALLFG